MITITSLLNPSTLSKIRKATSEAIKEAKANPRYMHYAYVKNNKNVPYIMIEVHIDKHNELPVAFVEDYLRRDITDLVRAVI